MTGHHAALGLGTAGIGNLYRPVTEADARATIEEALVGGITRFDTAPHYGFGLAERRLGAALAASEPGRAALVSTKVGRRLRPTRDLGERHGFVDADPYEPWFDYSSDGIAQGVECSLTRLQRSQVEVLLAHDLGEETHGSHYARHLRDFLDGGYRALCDLRDAGVARSIGIGVNEVAICLDLLARVDLDVILLAGRYTLLEQGALAELLPLCVERGVEVWIGGPFNSGILASDNAPGDGGVAHYNYAPAPNAIRQRAEELRAACAAQGASLRAAALAFPAAHPGITAVIAGMVGRAEVVEALHDWHHPPPLGLWGDLRAQGLIPAAAPTPTEKQT